jgi:hypothetical protein
LFFFTYFRTTIYSEARKRVISAGYTILHERILVTRLPASEAGYNYFNTPIETLATSTFQHGANELYRLAVYVRL